MRFSGYALSFVVLLSLQGRATGHDVYDPATGLEKAHDHNEAGTKVPGIQIPKSSSSVDKELLDLVILSPGASGFPDEVPRLSLPDKDIVTVNWPLVSRLGNAEGEVDGICTVAIQLNIRGLEKARGEPIDVVLPNNFATCMMSELSSVVLEVSGVNEVVALENWAGNYDVLRDYIDYSSELAERIESGEKVFAAVTRLKGKYETLHRYIQENNTKWPTVSVAAKYSWRLSACEKLLEISETARAEREVFWAEPLTAATSLKGDLSIIEEFMQVAVEGGSRPAGCEGPQTFDGRFFYGLESLASVQREEPVTMLLEIEALSRLVGSVETRYGKWDKNLRDILKTRIDHIEGAKRVLDLARSELTTTLGNERAVLEGLGLDKQTAQKALEDLGGGYQDTSLELDGVRKGLEARQAEVAKILAEQEVLLREVATLRETREGEQQSLDKFRAACGADPVKVCIWNGSEILVGEVEAD